jgi:Uncharacterized protein conserved in bacteria (DUF2188)
VSRQIVTVTWVRGAWRLHVSGLGYQPGSGFCRKPDAVSVGRGYCRLVVKRGHRSQLRIKGRDGRIQTEHTYGADPRRHKG